MVHWHWNIVKEQIISDFSISFFQEEKPTSRIPKPELDLLKKKKNNQKEPTADRPGCVPTLSGP